MRILAAALFALFLVSPAFAQDAAVEIDPDALAKAAAANEVKRKAEAMTEALKDSAGFVVVILDKDGGQRGGQVLVKPGEPGYDAVKVVVEGAVTTSSKSADDMLTEAGVKLKSKAEGAL